MHWPKTSRQTRSGFTLVELLAVIAIILVLLAILIPVTGSIRASAQDAECKNNLRQIGLAVQTYVTENGFYPPSVSGGETPSLGGARNGDIWAYYLRPYLGKTAKLTGMADDYSATKHSELMVCPAAAVVVEGSNISSYSANPVIMPDLHSANQNAEDDETMEAVRAIMVQRPSEVIILGDAIQRDTAGAHSNFWGVPEMRDSPGWSDPSQRNTPITLGSDTDGISEAQFRYRHDGHANVVFADGHVGSFEKGEILRKHVRKEY